MRMIKKNYRAILVIAIFLCVQLIYLSNATTNVPLMDYWYYINNLIPSLFGGGVSFSQVWNNAGIHRSPLQLILFLMNARYFRLNAQVEIYAGAFMMAVMAFFMYRYAKKFLIDNNEKQPIWMCVVLTFLIYNTNQFEILTEQFALSFSIRIILFVFGMICVDRYVCCYEYYKKYTVEIALLCLATVEMVGGGYFPAYLISIWCALFMGFLLINKAKRVEYIRNALLIIAAGLLAIIIYLYGIDLKSESSFSNTNVIKLMCAFFKGVINMLGVCLIGTHYAHIYIVSTGAAFASISLIVIVLYIKNKRYRQSIFPVMLYVYALAVMLLVFVGRDSLYGDEYAYMSRYVCETNLLVIAVILMAASVMKDSRGETLLIKRFLSFCIAGIVLCSTLSCVQEYQIAPYRKMYGMQLLDDMHRINQLPDEDFSRFQAQEDSVRSGIEILKRYHLGVYFYEN